MGDLASVMFVPQCVLWLCVCRSFWKRPADTAPCARCEQLQETVTSLEVELKIKER